MHSIKKTNKEMHSNSQNNWAIEKITHSPGDVNFSGYSTMSLSLQISASGPNRTTGRTKPAVDKILHIYRGYYL